MIDTHAHLDFKDFDKDREEVLRRFFDENGKFIVNIGVGKIRNEKSVELAKANERIFTAIGFHPEEVEKVSIDEVLENLNGFLKNKSENKIVAIGEIGLDYFHNRKNKKEQKNFFQAQIDVAKQNNLPVVIHCRDAYEDALEILQNIKNENLKAVMHCYMANIAQTEEFLKLPNLHFSFTGNITFSDFEKYESGKLSQQKAEIFKVIEKIPLERIMIETDCPFLAPVPFRGKRNEPAMVKEVARQIAKIRKTTFEEIEKITDGNAIGFFGLS